MGEEAEDELSGGAGGSAGRLEGTWAHGYSTYTTCPAGLRVASFDVPASVTPGSTLSGLSVLGAVLVPTVGASEGAEVRGAGAGLEVRSPSPSAGGGGDGRASEG